MSGTENDPAGGEVQFISPDEGTPAYEALAGLGYFAYLVLTSNFSIVL